MTANAGYHLFTTGDVLTAAQVQYNLQNQTIMYFASSAARTSALSGVVVEGMFSYLADTNSTEYYDGAAWQSISNPGDITGVTAGTGISGGGTSGTVTVSIDTAVTVDKTTAQTLTNKTLTSPALTTPTISTLTTNGDLLYGTGSGALSRLGIGSTSQVLTVTGGVPVWATPGGSSGPTFMAYSLTGNQNVTGTTWTAVTLSSEDWDSDSCYSTSTYRFTPTKSGYYQFNWMLQCSNTTLKSMWSAIYKNGSVHKYGTYTQMTTLDGSGNVGGSAVVYMNGSTDYVALYGLVEAGGGTPRFYAYGVENSRFDGVWIRS